MAARKTTKSMAVGPATYTTLIPGHVIKGMLGVVDGQPFRTLLSRGNAQSDFGRFKITLGDTLIAIHVENGLICPIARMCVVFKGTVADWNIATPSEVVSGYGLGQILVGERGTAMHFRRPLPFDVVRALRYDGVKGPRELKLKEDGRLAQAIGVDGVFRLMPESADELAAIPWI